MMCPERLCVVAMIVLLSACASREPADGPPESGSARIDIPGSIPDAQPKDEPHARYGNHTPYTVLGKTYHVMKTSAGYSERGVASWYGKKFHGRKTSSGEPYDMYAMTAAHKALPLPTYVEVTNLDNGRSAVVKVNDRGPFAHNRIIDLSYAAASKLGIIGSGTAFVEVRAIDPRQSSVSAGLASAVPEPDPAIGANGAIAVAHPADADIFVQVGAFSEYDNAKRMRQRLLGSGFDNTRLVQASINGRNLYRVRIGPLASVDAYDVLLHRLEGAGIDDAHLVTGE